MSKKGSVLWGEPLTLEWVSETSATWVRKMRHAVSKPVKIVPLVKHIQEDDVCGKRSPSL